MALSASSFANDMLTAYDNAGKLVGMDTAAKNQLKADWEFQYDLLFTHFKNNAVVTVEADPGTDSNTRFNQVMATGVVVALDGGASLKTSTIATSAIPSSDTSTGGIE